MFNNNNIFNQFVNSRKQTLIDFLISYMFMIRVGWDMNIYLYLCVMNARRNIYVSRYKLYLLLLLN